MGVQHMLPFGLLHITDRTLTELVHIILSEISGVAKTISKLTEPISNVVDRKKGTKGVCLKYDANELVIDVKVALFDNVSIFQTCYLIQEYIKEEIEVMTGLVVKGINVKVEQIIKVYPS
jgi:uncharacterized alkaline shock family protein YloU